MPRMPLRPLAYLLTFIVGLALYNSLRPSTSSSSRSALTFASSGSSRFGFRPPKGWSFGGHATDPPSFIPAKPDAAFVTLARNSELAELLPTLVAVEQTVNAHPYNSYPYVLLNDEAFTDYFKAKVETVLAEARIRFGGPHARPVDVRWGKIAEEHWKPPSWIDWDKAKRRWEVMKAQKLPYADSLSYRNMCRFQSGFFFKHPLIKDLEYYWRIEPSTRYTCNLVPSHGAVPSSWDAKADGQGDFFDPFRWMKQNGKKYGWLLSLKEYKQTIHTLWPKTLVWMRKNTQFHSPRLDLLPFILQEDKIGYNMCHFWSNFEIAALDFFHSEAYTAYFNMLEADGMFYYERTGDAPVHSIAASWFLSADQVHQFENIGYYHAPFHSCPQSPHSRPKCACDPRTSFQYDVANYSCQKEYDRVKGINSTERILEYNRELGLDIPDFRVLDIPHG